MKILINVIVFILAVLFVTTTLTGGANEKDIKEFLTHEQGYENYKDVYIEGHGYDFVTCNSGDIWQTEFVAFKPNGDYINGIVCEGFFTERTFHFKQEQP